MTAETAEVDWMPEARALAAQCWCDDETDHIEMNVLLAEAVARRIANWMATAAYYRGLLEDIGSTVNKMPVLVSQRIQPKTVPRQA